VDENGNPYLTDSEYEEMIAAAQSERYNGIADVDMSALEYLLKTINENYSDEIAQYQDTVSSVISEYTSDEYADAWANNPRATWEGMMQQIYKNGPDKTTREAITELLENMDGYVDEIEELAENWDSLSPENQETVSALYEELNTLRGMTVYQNGIFGQKGDMDGLWADVAGQVYGSSDTPSSLTDWLTEWMGEDYTAIYDAIGESVKPEIEEAYTSTQDTIDEIFSQGFSTSADVDITLNPSLNGLSSFSQYGSSSLLIPNQRADGGLATSPELTWFAENGPEMAIPIDGSSNAISLWEQTGRLLGMDSKLDSLELDGGSSSTSVEYKPTLQFYGDAPSKEDLTEALKISQDEFESLMEKYLKTHGRVSFA
jgi:hypothetical protein